MFEPITYLDWIENLPEEVEYDLGTSDLHSQGRQEAFEPTDHTYKNLKESLSNIYQVTPEQILITAGAGHANFLAIAAIVGIRDAQAGEPEFAIENPCYEPLIATSKSVGANINHFNRDPENDYDISIRNMREAKNPKTNLVIMTNRHNPSGCLADRSQLSEISEEIGDKDTSILVDEVYASYINKDTSIGDESRAFHGPTAAGLPHTIVTSSLTKFFGLEDLRIGWIIAEEEIIKQAKSVRWHADVVSKFSGKHAAEVLQKRSGYEERSRALLRTNHELLNKFINTHEVLDGTVFPGNVFGFFSHKSYSGDDLAAKALEEGILVTPGSYFGDDNRFRISVAKPTDEVAESLYAFGEFLENLDGSSM